MKLQADTERSAAPIYPLPLESLIAAEPLSVARGIAACPSAIWVAHLQGLGEVKSGCCGFVVSFVSLCPSYRKQLIYW